MPTRAELVAEIRFLSAQPDVDPRAAHTLAELAQDLEGFPDEAFAPRTARTAYDHLLAD